MSERHERKTAQRARWDQQDADRAQGEELGNL
jgi:hypothetical protein